MIQLSRKIKQTSFWSKHFISCVLNKNTKQAYLGSAYYRKGEYTKAIDCCEKALPITREIGDSAIADFVGWASQD